MKKSIKEAEAVESDSKPSSTVEQNIKKRGRKTIAIMSEIKLESNDVYSFKSSSSDSCTEDRAAAIKEATDALLNNKDVSKTKQSRLSLRTEIKEELEQNTKQKTKRKSTVDQTTSNQKTSRKIKTETENDTETESLDNNDKEREEILADLEYIKLQSTNQVIRKENICFICEFSEDLIECRGACQRSVHLDCVGLFVEPKEGYKCSECIQVLYDCFICKKPSLPKENFGTKKCAFNKCGRYYHDECIKQNDLFRKESASNGVAKHTCPLHTCATCCSEATKFTPEFDSNDVAAVLQPTKGRLYQCARCPTAYHASDYCLAAGSVILDGLNIICPRHFQPIKSLSQHCRVNVSWCFVCCTSGELIGCVSCPASYHLKCIRNPPSSLLAMMNTEEAINQRATSPQPSSSGSVSQQHSPSSSVASSSMASSSLSANVNSTSNWQCEDCVVGKRPVTGEIVWAKAGNYRWWPAQICHERNLPENLQNKTYQTGEYPVKFFGTNDYYWINIGRCFSFHEADEMHKSGGTKGKSLAVAYQTGVKHAIIALKEIKKIKMERLMRATDGQISKKSFQNFQFIKTNKPVGNVTVQRKPVSELPLCNCDSKTSNPCGTDDCLNRILKYECHPSLCPAGERCQNQRFVKRIYPKQQPFNTGSRGTGLKALVDIKKGDFVNEYVGELIDDEECKRRLELAHENDICNFYFLTIDKDRVIDAGPKGNLCRYMNHCCDPNCETQKWLVNGDIRVGLFARTDIPANTELTFNYNLDCLSNAKAECKCGAKNCSGFIGDRPKTSKDDQKIETKVLKTIASNGVNSPLNHSNSANSMGKKSSKRKLSESGSESQANKARSKSATPKAAIPKVGSRLKDFRMENIETSSTTSSTSSSMSGSRKKK